MPASYYSKWSFLSSDRQALLAFLSVTILLQVIPVYQHNRLQYQLETPTNLPPCLPVMNNKNDYNHNHRNNTLEASHFQWNLNPLPNRKEPRTWEAPDFQPTRPLNFVHIPKNAGSSIVQAAIDANLSWGDCLFQREWPGRVCPHPPSVSTPPPTQDKHNEDEESHSQRIPWHLPVYLLDESPYTGSDLFAVMRNPYERAVSEFYYRCEQFPVFCKGLDGRKADRVLNRNIQLALKTVYHATYKSEDYYAQWSHWIPQYDYFYKRPSYQRVLQHVLHVELLEEEFASLMKAYGYHNVTLPKVPVKKRSDERMTVQNLTMETIKLLEVVFERDFELGGYEILSPKLHAQIELEDQQ